MTIQAVAVPAGWIVEGEIEICGSCNGHDISRSGDVGSSCYCCNGGANEIPPSVLTDAIGKPCEACEGSGCDIDYCTDCGDEYSDPCDRHDDHSHWSLGCEDEPCCPACLVDGKPTGLASVELTLPCLVASGQTNGMVCNCADCQGTTRYHGDGYRGSGGTRHTVRVIPDKVLRIMSADDKRANPATEAIYIASGPAHHWGQHGGTAYSSTRIDIGPNPAQHIGRYLVTGRQVEVEDKETA